MAEKTIRLMGKDIPVQEQSAPISAGMVKLPPETQSNLKEYFKQVMFDGEGKYADQFKEAALGGYTKGMKKGMKKGGKVSASSRADGIATKGKTRGRIV
jgi:hypothetical protein